MRDMAKPLSWVGWIFAGFGGLIFAAALWAMAASGDFSDAAGLTIPLLFFFAGLGLVALARRMRRDEGFEFGHLAFWIFGVAGMAMFVGGIALTFEDPAGLILVAMGSVFTGAGWLARKVFTTPAGMKSVTVETGGGTVRHWTGAATTRRSATFIHVPVDATDDEVEAARRGWTEARLRHRPDWLSGRIDQEAKRMGGALKYASFAVAGFAAIFAAVGWFVDEFFFLIAGFAGIAALVIAWKAAGQAARERKFGHAEFVMRKTPVSPGERIEGMLETRAARRDLADGTFRLTLACTNTVRYRSGDKTRTRTETLWSDEATVRASGEQMVKVRVGFDTPGHLPEASLTRSDTEGVDWTLTAEAAAPGIDFIARFTLPVVDAPQAERIGR